MGLDVLLEILGPLKAFATEVTSMRLQWYMDTDMRGDMIAFHDGDSAATPPTGKVEVVGTLASDMVFTDMVLF